VVDFGGVCDIGVVEAYKKNKTKNKKQKQKQKKKLVRERNKVS
jgi:hypothetical protein